jgi:hypothetical protein
MWRNSTSSTLPLVILRDLPKESPRRSTGPGPVRLLLALFFKKDLVGTLLAVHRTHVHDQVHQAV